MLSGKKVTVHCTGYGKNNDLSQKFWSTKDPGQEPFSFIIGRGMVIKGWDEGVLTMVRASLVLLYTLSYIILSSDRKLERLHRSRLVLSLVMGKKDFLNGESWLILRLCSKSRYFPSTKSSFDSCTSLMQSSLSQEHSVNLENKWLFFWKNEGKLNFLEN